MTMTWKNNIHRWRQLSPQEQRRLRLRSSPTQVWQSMLFEREQVSLSWLQARHKRLLQQQDSSIPPSDG
jgi:hypothetical protein